MLDQTEFRQKLQRIETLVRQIESADDSEARTDMLEIVQRLMEINGAGIERMLEIVFNAGDAGGALIDELARDESVEGLLLLYGLHPQDIPTRVRQAIEKTRPLFQLNKAVVELAGFNDGIVSLKLEAPGAAALALKTTLEEAIYERAPDLAGLEIEIVTPAKPPVFVQIRRMK
jgi:hypothetical protein